MKLQGVRVLDISMFLPGPMLTLMMADHGADVIRIEPPGTGEPTREIGYQVGGMSAWFRNTHRGKRSIQLDLKTAEGRTTLLDLARDADVFVEAFRPGVAARLGFDYPTLGTENPRLIYCSISAFGQDGPRRDLPAHDLAVEALAGVLPLNEGQDGKPAMPHMPVADALASLTGLAGVLMALHRRHETGRGDYIDAAMFDSLLAWTPNISGRIFATGQPHVPKEERSWGGNAMYNLYETADAQWIVLGGAEIKFAANLLHAVGRPDLLPLAALPPGPGQEPLRDYLRNLFRTRTRADWQAWFAGRDIAFAPVRTLAEAFTDPANRLLSHDPFGTPLMGTPIRFLEEPARLNPAAPALNADHGTGWRA